MRSARSSTQDSIARDLGEVGHPYQDHVYAVWSVFNGSSVDLRISVYRDRGATFSRYSSFTTPSVSGHASFYVRPSIDASGDVYLGFVGEDKQTKGSQVSIYVAKSTDDGRTFTALGTVPRSAYGAGH